MRVCSLGLLGMFMLAGCGSSGLPTTNSSANDSAAAGTDASSANYTSIACDDDLRDVVAHINQYRTQAQLCGDTSYPAVDELVWNDLLALAAEEHASNMANYDFFSHSGVDGSSVGARVNAQGYSWRYVAENIAAGYFNAETVVAGLMDSEGHCKNIMSATVTEVGLACAVNYDSSYNTYWTQVFATSQ